MDETRGPCWQPLPWLRFPLLAFLALGVLGGISPRGAELVPFRGIDAEDAPQLRALGLPEPVASESSVDFSLEAEFKAGTYAMGRGELEKAKKAFKAGLSRQPQHLGCLMNLGWIAQREKQWVDAETFLKRAQSIAPDNGSVWLALGVVYLEQDRIDFALAAFSQVAALEPANARARRMLGLTLGRKEWYSAAEGELRKALELEPNDPGAHFNLAVIYLQRQPVAIELARRHYNISLDLGSAPDAKVEAMLEPSKTSPVAVKSVSAGR